MKDPSAAMQVAIHGKLMASVGLAAAMGGTVRAYDKVLANPAYPFIRIGDDQLIDQSNGCADGWDVVVTLNIFSRDAQAPRMNCKAISNQVLQAITDPAALPQLTGFVVRYCELQQARTFFEGDGVTVHGVLIVSYRVRELA